MPLRRSIASLLAVGTVAVAGLAGAAPAQAANDLKVCADDDGKGKCLYRSGYDSNFANDLYCQRSLKTVQDRRDCRNPFTDGGVADFEDKTSSVSNRTSKWWKLYEDRGYGGYVLCLRPGGYDSNLGNNTPQEDDISSVKIQGTSQPRGCDQVIG